MKKILLLINLMIVIIILLPLLIVGGLNVSKKGYGKLGEDENKGDDETGVIMIKVYDTKAGEIKNMELEEYVKGVVAAEMPAEFSLEALKAQAVAARTYAFARKMNLYKAKENPHVDADICTDHTHCQAWISKEDAMKKWSFLMAFVYWNKIDKAVRETQNLIITYENQIINPVFHSNSGGRTENAEDVWDCDAVPYLKSVLSSGEEASPNYQVTVNIDADEFCDKLEEQYENIEINRDNILGDIKIESYTPGGRVDKIRIGNITLKGTEFRAIFSLRSANFKIEEGKNGNIKITTIGSGHGVGMSQWGANYLAKSGGSYEEILKYYYTGVSLMKIGDWMKMKGN